MLLSILWQKNIKKGFAVIIGVKFGQFFQHNAFCQSELQCFWFGINLRPHKAALLLAFYLAKHGIKCSGLFVISEQTDNVAIRPPYGTKYALKV